MKESIDYGETIPAKGGKEVQRERTQVQPKSTQTQKGSQREQKNISKKGREGKLESIISLEL